jgi:hypothetical protein
MVDLQLLGVGKLEMEFFGHVWAGRRPTLSKIRCYLSGSGCTYLIGGYLALCGRSRISYWFLRGTLHH